MLVDMHVLSFCHYLQGPACTQYLADMGADVIKVEPPGGAFERHWSGGESYVDGVSAFLMCANRNKRSLAIDLKNPAAKDIMDRLVDWADVVVENFRPGVMERLVALCREIPVGGRQVHDANIVATMLAHDERQLLTLNTSHFQRYRGQITLASV